MEPGLTATMPDDLSVSGSQFTGWYTDTRNLWDFDTPVTADLTLTSRFSVIEDRTVVIDAKNVDSVEIGYNEDVDSVIAVFEDAQMVIDTTKLKDQGDKLVISIDRQGTTDKYDALAVLGEKPYNKQITIVLPYDETRGNLPRITAPRTGAILLDLVGASTSIRRMEPQKESDILLKITSDNVFNVLKPHPYA